MADDTQKVYNDDIVGVYRRVNKFIEEVQKSASANVADINEHDVVRINSYLDSLTKYLDWIVEQPNLDLPESHPRSVTLEAVPAIIPVENLMARDIVRLFERLREETTNSQSARNATGLIKFDETRARAVIDKCRNYLDNYVAIVTPIDLPESSPNSPDSGQGRTGINP